jgi:mono/diheme cytochrome c family protein
MHRLRWYLLGAASGLLFLAALGAALVLPNTRGFSALEQPTRIESFLARAARSAAIPAGSRDRANPVPNTPETLDDARAHWADHCALCHGNDGVGDTELGRHTYPPAPDMRLPATQRLSDGELFYVIQNGIRLSAMPAWGGGSEHDEEASWKLVHFIRHLPRLTDAEKSEMQKLNPKSPDELREEKEEEEFLKGRETNEKPLPHHHR